MLSDAVNDASTLDELFAARARQNDTTGVEIRKGVERLLFGDCSQASVPAALGRLELRGRLGSGAHGEVFRAHDPLLDRDVAVKLLHRGSSLHDEGRARLRREAQALAAITHTNVVSLYDVAIVADSVYVVMELVEGRDLAAWLRDDARDWRVVVALFIELAEGLAAVHRCGLVHRDVKPSNVLVDAWGRPHLADFGLSTLSAAIPSDCPSSEITTELVDLGRTLTRTGTLLGTPAYMAPEQHEDAHVDARADQYAFCVALWEALYGRRPFHARDIHGLMARKEGDLPRPADRRGVPRRVHAVLERGLRRDRAARHADMDALVVALRRASSRRDRSLAFVGVLGCGAVGAAAWPTAAPCHQGAARADDRWQAQRHEIEASLQRSGLPYATTTFARVDADIDAWTSAWSSAWVRACDDERSSSSAAAAAQMRCLDAALGELDGFALLMRGGDARFIASAVDAAQALPSVDRCRDPRGAAAMPDDESVTEVRALVGRGRHLVRATMLDDAAQTLARAESLVAARDDEDIALELDLAVAELALVRTADASTMQRVESLAWRALAADRSEIAVEAMLALAAAYAGERASGSAEDGLQWIERVEPFIARLGDTQADARRRLYRSALAGYTGDIATKIALAQSVLDLPPDVLPESSQWRGQAWSGLGTGLRLSGRHAEARHAYEQALAHQERTLGPDHPATVGPLVGLANLELLQREHAEAQRLLERALALATATYGEEDVRAIRVRTDLGNVALQREHFELAHAQYQRVRRTLDATLGPRHPTTAQAATNEANAAAFLGRLDEAEAGFRDAIGVLVEIGEHPDLLAGARVRYGDLLTRRGRLEEAREQFEGALESVTDDERSPDLVAAIAGLAQVAGNAGDFATAAKHQRRVIELRETASPTSRALVRINLAMMLVETNDLDEARTLVDEAESLLPEPRDALAQRLWTGISELRAGPLKSRGARDRPPPSSSTAAAPPRPPAAPR
jgi:tetratricopeptide (TPR) repeat protein